MRNNNNLILVILTLGILISACAASNMGGTPTGKFKNLKVLPKDVTEAQLDEIMDGFNAALGVKCNFCHERNEAENKMDFASDAKPEKGTARLMYTMTMDINKEHFGFGKNNNTTMSVTCFTCHNGNEHPATNAPKKQEATPAVGSK